MDSKNGTLSGNIMLIDSNNEPLDELSNVTIALYKSTKIDTSLIRINNQHPNIGIRLCQNTEFDHRGMTAYKISTTDSKGRFSFNKVPEGNYNLIILQGEKYYARTVDLSINKNQDTYIDTIEIRPMVRLSGFVMEPYQFRKNRTYLVEDDCTFMSDVLIEGGTNIFINAGVNLSFVEHVNIVQIDNVEYWRIDTASHLFDIYGDILTIDDYFGSVRFNANNQKISDGQIKHSVNGLNISGNNCEIYNIDVNTHVAGISFSAGPSHINRLLMRKTSNRGLQIMSMSDSTYVENSVFYDNEDAVILYVGGGYYVKNNYFQDNKTAIYPQNCSGFIQNNSFFNNEFDITQYIATANVQFNTFYLSKVWSIYPRRFITLKNNNFYASNLYFINIRREGASGNSCVSTNVDATMNYWKPIDLYPYILDGNHNHNYPPERQCRHFVITEPRLSRPVAGAGVQ
jgi:hypothetical protein